MKHEESLAAPPSGGPAAPVVDRPWICFHCGFETSDPAEAEAHFGDRDDAEEFTPICRWWRNTPDAERVYAMQDLHRDLVAERAENARLDRRVEGLEYETQSQSSVIAQYFKGCSTIYQAYCEFETMEGRALAAEKLWAFLEQRGVQSVYLTDGTQLNPGSESLRGAVCRLFEIDAQQGPARGPDGPRASNAVEGSPDGVGE
jgi:hypothetical protein